MAAWWWALSFHNSANTNIVFDEPCLNSSDVPLFISLKLNAIQQYSFRFFSLFRFAFSFVLSSHGFFVLFSPLSPSLFMFFFGSAVFFLISLAFAAFLLLWLPHLLLMLYLFVCFFFYFCFDVLIVRLFIRWANSKQQQPNVI